MFHINLRAIRFNRGLSQKQVADYLSISPQSVSKWEKGDALPSIEYLPKLAECFNCDINSFFEESKKYAEDYSVIGSFFALMAGYVKSKTVMIEDIAVFVSKNAGIVDTAESVCKDLMEYKTVNTRCIRGMLDCSESEARTFIGYLEQCEMVEQLDIKDSYYVVKDAVEGMIPLLRLQEQVCEIIIKLEST